MPTMRAGDRRGGKVSNLSKTVRAKPVVFQGVDTLDTLLRANKRKVAAESCGGFGTVQTVKSVRQIALCAQASPAPGLHRDSATSRALRHSDWDSCSRILNHLRGAYGMRTAPAGQRKIKPISSCPPMSLG